MAACKACGGSGTWGVLRQRKTTRWETVQPLQGFQEVQELWWHGQTLDHQALCGYEKKAETTPSIHGPRTTDGKYPTGSWREGRRRPESLGIRRSARGVHHAADDRVGTCRMRALSRARRE